MLLTSVAGMAFFASVQSVRAEPISWNGDLGGEDAWNDPTNWNPTGLPTIDDDVVIGYSRASVSDAQSAGSIQLITGGLTIEETGQLTFQSVDLIVVEDMAGSLDNYGQVSGDLRESQASVNNFGGASWVGDVIENTGMLINRGTAIWTGDVHKNSGDLYSLGVPDGEDRPQWVGDVRVNDGTLFQENGDWVGNVELNNYYLESKFNSTWTGDVWSNTDTIFNSDTSTWTGDVLSNAGYIDNYDTESTWVGDVLANSGTLFNFGTWSGDILSNTGTVSSFEIWNGSMTSSGVLRLAEQVNGAIENSGTLQLRGDLSGITVLTNTGILDMTHNSNPYTLSVESVSFGPDSTLAINIDATGVSDKINVDGAATLGGIVNVLAEPGAYEDSVAYTILSADTLEGEFSGVSTDLAFFAARLSYVDADVNLMLLRNDLGFADIGATPNQESVGTIIESFGAGNAVFDEILWLSGEDVGLAFDSLSGEIHASAYHATLDTAEVVTSNLQRRAALMASTGASADLLPTDPASEVMTAWYSVLGQSGEIDADGNAAKLDYGLIGMVGGVDSTWQVMNGTLVVGLAGAYTHTDADVRGRASTANFDSGHASLYGAWDDGALRLSGSASYALHGIDTQRHIRFGGIDQTAEADYLGHTFGVSTEAAYRFDLAGLMVGPVATFDVLHSRHEGATETGADELNLRIQSANERRIHGGIGLLAGAEWASEAVQFSTEVRVIYKHAYDNGAPSQRLAFTDAPDAGFRVLGPEQAEDWITVGGHVQAELNDALSLNVGYEGSFANGGHAHQGNVALSYRF